MYIRTQILTYKNIFKNLKFCSKIAVYKLYVYNGIFISKYYYEILCKQCNKREFKWKRGAISVHLKVFTLCSICLLHSVIYVPSECNMSLNLTCHVKNKKISGYLAWVIGRIPDI